MDKELKRYEEKFGEQFPLMLCKGCDDDEIIEIVNKCMVENKPYSVINGDY